ncbi:MAG: cation transporter [Chthoniobacteraceae bacterium]
MIKQLLTIIATTALATLASAETTVKLSNVHLCCGSCVKGVEKAVATVSGVTAACDKDAGTVTLTAADKATTQKAVDALDAAGYFGKSSDSAVSFKDNSGAKDGKVSALTVKDVHLCCDKCVKAVGTALGKVKGVSSNTAEKKATSFEVKGDFNPKEVMAALQDAGLTGKAK